MVKTLVLYFSKYGTTRKYAELISDELGCEIFSINNFKQNNISNYNTIIIGSGLYAGKIRGIDIIVKNYEILKDKKLVLFTCGLADYSKIENINSIYKRIKKEFPEKIIENMKIFYLRGGINYKKLTLKHRIMMWLMKRMILKKGIDKLNEENKEFINTYGKVLDFIDKNSITEIIKYCR